MELDPDIHRLVKRHPRERLNDLKQQAREGKLPDVHLFWGGIFSQWHAGVIDLSGVSYPTAEHFMMVSKALMFNDIEAADKIMADTSPRAAKETGRQVRGFNEKEWDKYRYTIVLQGNVAKFTQDKVAQKALLDTGEATIVEASPVDRIWGIGLAEEDPDARNPLLWRGLNGLGFALMDVRDYLREECA